MSNLSRRLLRPSSSNLRVNFYPYPFSHTFCKRCFNQWDKVSNGRCPMCREEYNEAYTSRDLIAFNIINDLCVLCVNKGMIE